MTTKGSCNYLNDLGKHCDRTYELHEFYFRDPNYRENYEAVDLCKWHAEEITNQVTSRVKDFQMKLSNMISEAARKRQIAREYGRYDDNFVITQKIEDMKSLIKKLTNNECKNMFCNQPLNYREKYSKLYSCHVFKPNGRRWYTFYFCSIRCFNIMKGKCGIPTLINQGQTTLRDQTFNHPDNTSNHG